MKMLKKIAVPPTTDANFSGAVEKLIIPLKAYFSSLKKLKLLLPFWRSFAV